MNYLAYPFGRNKTQETHSKIDPSRFGGNREDLHRPLRPFNPTKDRVATRRNGDRIVGQW